MAEDRDLIDLQEKIQRCNRCGFCQDACPTYKVTGNEFDVARGRHRLARLMVEGKYGWGDEGEINRHLGSCLLCKACEEACPSGVATEEIITRARGKINAARGMPPFQRLMYRGLLSHNRRLALGSRLLRFYQRSGIRQVVRGSGILRLLRGIGNMEDIIPALPATPLRQQLQVLGVEAAAPLHRVAYFPGCAINFLYIDIGRASVDVLQKNGCRVEVPGTVCCGGPHRSAGDFDEFKRLARKNIEAFIMLDVEVFITDCATCGSVLKEYGNLLRDDPAYRDKALDFSSRVRDINQYLLEIGFSRRLGPLPVKVSYHDPCHLNRSQKIKSAPRLIMKSIPGLELVEMQYADMCCGGAGAYGITHPDISEKILNLKIESFKSTGANFLVTSCPSCSMQLDYGLKKHGLKAPTLHPVQLLAQSYNTFGKSTGGESDNAVP